MKSNFISNLFHPRPFKLIALATFIVYFITSICGYFNFLFAYFTDKIYFPLRSYILPFNKNEVTFVNPLQNAIYNLAGYKAQIHTNIPYKLIDDLFFTLISTILIVLFYLGYKVVKEGNINQTEIIKWSVVYAILMSLAIPSNSADLYGYIARGAQQTLYNHNPYLRSVSEIKEYSLNPLFINFMWPNQPTTYGPVFIYLTKAIVFLSNNNFFLSFLNFKLLNLTLFLLLILFVLKLNKTNELYLIAWNPLVLIQGLWNCHNDLISGVLIFFGIYLLVKGDYFWSIFFLVVAVGVKYVSLLIIPIILFYLFRTKLKKETLLNFILGLCSGIILIFIFSADFLFQIQEGSQIVFNKLFLNVDLVHKSFIATVYTVIKYINNWQYLNLDLDLILIILKYIFYFIFILFYLWILLRVETYRGMSLQGSIALVLFIFLGFTLGKFHSWYLLNLIFLIPLLGGEGARPRLLRKLLITLSMTHVFAITFIDQAKILNFVSMTLLPTLFVLFRGKK